MTESTATTREVTAAPIRLRYIDNIRVGLCLWIVAFHAVLPYQYDARLWFVNVPEELGVAFALFLEISIVVLMPMFFFVAGVFMPGSYNRHQFGIFVRRKLLRFGAPLVILSVTMMPPLFYIRHLVLRGGEDIGFLAYVSRYLVGIGGQPQAWPEQRWPDFNFGHLWFIEQLLIMSVLYALTRRLLSRDAQSTGYDLRPPGTTAIAIFAILIGTVLWRIRQDWPAHYWFGLFGFIQTSATYLVTCPGMFVAGLLAGRFNWLQRTPERTGWIWLGFALILILARCLLDVAGVEFRAIYNTSLARCLWEACVGVGISVGTLVLGRRVLDMHIPLFRSLAPNSYGIYLFHVPFVVCLQAALLSAEISMYAKVAIVFLGGCIGAYALTASLILMFPPLRRVV